MLSILWRGSVGRTIGVAVAAASFGACSSDPTSPLSALDPDVEAAVDLAIQDEYRAENTYLRVLADFGDVTPFRNIVYAEQRHSEAIAALLIRRDLPVPLSAWDINNVAQYASVAEACQAGVQAELDNIALYDSFFALPLPADVKSVFENNRAASLERHLPAFQACS